MVPPIKLYEAGKRNDAAFEIVCRNSRLPDHLRGDVDAEIKAQDALASVKAESLVAQQYKMRAESDSDKRKVKSKPKTETPTSVVADRKALEWQKKSEFMKHL